MNKQKIQLLLLILFGVLYSFLGAATVAYILSWSFDYDFQLKQAFGIWIAILAINGVEVEED